MCEKNNTNYEKKLSIPAWCELTDSQRKQAVVYFFEKLKKELDIDFCLTFEIPKGWEQAYGRCSEENKEIFINPNFIEKGSLLCLFNLFHEIRHAWQFKKYQVLPEDKKHKGMFKNNDYYFLSYGEVYRLTDQKEIFLHYEIKKDQRFLLELYTHNPLEVDADKWAVKILNRYIKKSNPNGIDEQTTKDLDKIINFFAQYNTIFTSKNSKRLFNLCCKVTELGYQYYLGNIKLEDFNKKEQEYYKKIDLIIDKPTKENKF